MLELLSATFEEDSTTDDEDGSSLDELSTDEEDSSMLEELVSEEDIFSANSVSIELLEDVAELEDTGLSEEDDSATISKELLTAATSLKEDCTLLLDSFVTTLEEDPFDSLWVTLDDELLSGSTLLELDENFPIPSITSSELLDVISPIGLVEDSVSPPHPTNDMHAAPASRQRMIALKAEKRLGQERRIWVVILLILHALLFHLFYIAI